MARPGWLLRLSLPAVTLMFCSCIDLRGAKASRPLAMDDAQENHLSMLEASEHGLEEDGIGYKWSRCGGEGEVCSCSTGIVRYGIGERWLQTQLDGKGTPLIGVCSPDLFEGRDPAKGKQKECWCQSSESVKTAANVTHPSVAIVLLSRRPADLKTWLQYHLNHVGVNHVFLSIEDTPDFDTIWKTVSEADQKRVSLSVSPLHPHGDNRPMNNYTELQHRQKIAMVQAKAASMALSIEWLIHIDDDELLYVPTHRSIGEVLASVPQEKEQVYITNKEAVYDSDSAELSGDHCFTDTRMVNMNDQTFAAYANGKAAIRVSADAVPDGAHSWKWQMPTNHMSTQQIKEVTESRSVSLTSPRFGPPLWLLHFESCPYSRWKDKFWELGNTSPEKVEAIPFPFYRQSIKRMQSCRNGSTRSVQKGDCSERQLQALWRSWKTMQNSHFTPEDMMPVNIPWSAIKASSSAFQRKGSTKNSLASICLCGLACFGVLLALKESISSSKPHL